MSVVEIKLLDRVDQLVMKYFNKCENVKDEFDLFVNNVESFKKINPSIIEEYKFWYNSEICDLQVSFDKEYDWLSDILKYITSFLNKIYIIHLDLLLKNGDNYSLKIIKRICEFYNGVQSDLIDFNFLYTLKLILFKFEKNFTQNKVLLYEDNWDKIKNEFELVLISK